MTFCTHCGAPAEDAFCPRCGTPSEQAESHSVPILDDASTPHEPATSHGAPPDAHATPGPVSQFVPVQPSYAWQGATLDPDPAPVIEDPPTRAALVWETRFVMVAFLVPAVLAAVIVFAQHEAGVGGVTPFPSIVHQPLENMILGIVAYLSVGAVVPLALFLLARSGRPPSTLGLGIPGLRSDLVPGLGLAAAAFGSELLLLTPFARLLAHNSSLVSHVSLGHVPAYYVVWGISVSAVTAITEEVLVNGYLITRLEQFGWTPTSALVLSLVLRTSYHVYYGLGFLLVVPFGFFVTRSFQKHHRLTRSIAAHFLYDAVLLTILILR